MQCSSCGTTLQPGETTCPSCGATVAADTSDSSAYEGYAETVPYIPYTASEQKAPNPATLETPMPESSSLSERGSYGSSTPPDVSRTQETPSSDQETQAGDSWATYTESPKIPVEQPQPLPTRQDAGLPPELAAPSTQRPQKRGGLAASVIALLIILILLIIGSGSGLIYYLTTFHPAELRTQATVVTQNVLSQARAQFDALPPQQLYTQVTSNNPTITDPLNNPDTSLWITNTQNGISCNLTAGAYHASVSTKSIVALCLAPATNFQDIAFQVQMTILKGDEGGLIFRSAPDASGQLESYFFGLDAAGGYHLLASTQNGVGPLHEDSSPAIITGLKQPNLITVIARGNKFYLYVNKHFVIMLKDSTYTTGRIGLFAADIQNPTDVVFSNAQVWTL